MRLIPATEDMLPYTGILAYPEAQEFLKLWGGGYYAVLDDGQPFALLAIQDHWDDKRFCIGNAWVIPEYRGRWLTAETRELIASFGLMRHEGILAGTARKVCGRFLRANGFKMYCQDGDTSYYLLARKAQ